MRKLIYILCLMIGVTACGQSSREEIINRYPGGEKRTVATYRGSGADEQLIERTTYNIYGDLIRKENILKNTSKSWIQLNPKVQTANGLEEYLQGKWLLVGIYDGGIYLDANDAGFEMQLNVEGNVFEFDGTLDSFSRSLRYDQNTNLKNPDTGEKMHLSIKSENTFRLNLDGTEGLFRRR